MGRLETTDRQSVHCKSVCVCVCALTIERIQVLSPTETIGYK